MNKLKVMAGQTALYGISSILARVINFLLVPIHTKIFFPDEFGTITLFYSYTAILNILYTFGLETAYFRFTTKEKSDRYYHYSITTILVLGSLFSVLLVLFSGPIASALGSPDKVYIVNMLAGIILIDALLAIPFAKLRLENRAVRFVFARVSGIMITILLNIFFLIFLREIHHDGLSLFSGLKSLYNPEFRIGYVFLANLIGSASVVILLWSEIRRYRFRFNIGQVKPLLFYSFPVMLTGIAGMFNENLDKILIPEILPESFYSNLTPIDALGVYGAAFKLGIFMMLAVQAFRFAGEPFFFSNAENKNAPELFARVLHYFVLFSCIILVAVSWNVDLIALLFLRNPSYWEMLYLVPVFLLAKLLYGIYINLAIWYKIKDKTIYGTYFTLIGSAITIAGNVILIPILGLAGSAITFVFCYLTMCIIAFVYGKKYFPVPYKWFPVIGYILISSLISFISFKIELSGFWLDSGINLGVPFLFIIFIFLVERKRFIKSKY